jgi:2-polyprenyl-3-methyl-5-hydroxy-6-metoxy-1,4-benzoquinol methylase
MNCPICNGPSELWCVAKSLTILQCKNDDCGFKFLDLGAWKAPYLNKDYYQDISTVEIKPAAAWITARVELIRKFKSNGDIAELGCGVGETAIALSRAGYSVVAVDESVNAIEFLHGKYRDVEWINSTIENMLEERPRYFDAVTLFHVLEHIPFPKNLIRLVERSLKPDGVIVIEVPDISGGLAKLSGKNWDYILDHHVNYFNVKSLTKLMQAFGYRPRLIDRTFHFSYPQGHAFKDLVKGALAFLGLNSIIRTAWTK